MIQISVLLNRGEFTLEVDVSIDAHVTGVFGPSGAGKTTLINVIAGLERPRNGKIVVGGETLFDSERGIDVATHRRRVGVVFQEHRLFPHLSVKGNLEYGKPRGFDGDGREFRHVVDVLEVGGLLDRRVDEMSGGERQRVALGRALMSRPTLLLLDEPLASLDVRLKQQIVPYLRRVRDDWGIPILYVSHDLTEILQLTDQLMVLERGVVVGHGRFTELVHSEAVVNVVHDSGMRNVMIAKVVKHEPSEGISVVQIGPVDEPTRRWIVPECSAVVGASVTVIVQPWEIALASGAVQGVSIQNQIAGVVTRCTMHERRAIVEVDVGVPLIVELSKRSAAALEIAAGRPIVCLIKSHAIGVK